MNINTGVRYGTAANEYSGVFMKKFLLLFLALTVCSGYAMADSSHASLVQVRRTHHHVQRHHAHKAAKHKAPKHHYRSV
jgi:hypothetical protein